MAHEVKRSKNSNDLCSIGLSSSSTGEPCSEWAGSSVNDDKIQACVLGISPGEQVFRIDWIREQILNYVIHNNKEKLSRKLIKNLRLVQKSWLATTTKLIKKCKDPPLIELTLDNTDSYDIDPADNIKGNKKKLDQFIESFGCSTRLQQSFLPFKLKLDSDFFRYENHQSLSDYFTRFGSELMELEIIYPRDGGNMPVSFPPFHFPILRKLSFEFSGNFYIPLGDDISNFADNRFGLWFLQSILNATKNLQELAIPDQDYDEDLVPVTFEFLQLPPTIVSLTLELELESKTLETFLLRDQLPNLANLTLRLHEKPFVNGLMYKILERFQKTLTSLHVLGLQSDGYPHSRTYFQFPLMEKLEVINISSTECELDAAQLTPLQEYLPKLNCLSLTFQTEAMLRKWIENSKFENVKKIIIVVVNEHLSAEKNNYFRSPSWETMTQLSEAFANVKDLTLHLNIGFLNVLRYVSTKMTKVNFLEIKFHGKMQRNSSNLVDSMLTGLPLGLVGSLKENNVDVLKSELILTNDSQSSIRNPTELATLMLGTKDDTTGEAGQVSLASDLLFGQAFLKMPNLRNLYFDGKFQPSIRMEKKWKDQGRFIKYLE